MEFTTDWQKDAERRDLTINSMFLGNAWGQNNTFSQAKGFFQVKPACILEISAP